MKQRFPILVTHNGVNAKIQRDVKIQRGRKYDTFLVIYSEAGKRQRLRRSSLEAAKIAAQNACHKISHGEHLTLELKNGERLTYARAIESLAPLGVKLDIASHEYANAVKRLPSGATLQDAVELLCRRNNAVQEKRTVKQAVGEMLEVKHGANLSDAHIKDLECRLGAFAEAFQMQISDVSGALLQTWIDSLKVSGRTKQNYLRAVAALIYFAIRRKWLPKEATDEIEAVQLPKEDSAEIEIFTPGEMAEILSVARPEMVPWLAIAGFAGLRSAEISRLDWSEVKLSERFIEIKASKAKTAARRLAPVTDNLAKWLELYAAKSGLVAPFDSWWNQMPLIAQAVNKQREHKGQPPNFVWRHNALRHSFCSYRLAAIKNAAQVALEAGNSPQMIFKHYRQVVTETEAAKWFSIMPPVEVAIQKLAA